MSMKRLLSRLFSPVGSRQPFSIYDNGQARALLATRMVGVDWEWREFDWLPYVVMFLGSGTGMRNFTQPPLTYLYQKRAVPR